MIITFLRMLDLQTAKDRRQREGSGYFWINIQQRLLSKERMKKTDEEFDRLWLQGMEARNGSGLAVEQSEEQEGVCSGSTQRQKESPLCFVDGHLSSLKCGIGT